METNESATPSTLADKFSSLWDKGKLFFKGVIIFVMALALWIPTAFIRELVQERKGRQNEAIADISSKWAGRQIITGPILMIPYTKTERDANGNTVIFKRNAYFMADKLDIHSTVFPEKRHRGIYQVAVYRSDVVINAKFKALPWEQLKIPAENFLWNESMLLLGIQDNAKGINEDIYVNWADSNILFSPQPPGLTGFTGALMANTVLNLDEAAKEHNCTIKFSVNGSEQLLFTAAARENKLEMRSSWPNPSFTGVKLPDTREVRDSGFVAEWKYMNRSLPQVWDNSFNDMSGSLIGAALIIPIDSYDKTERSVKYALLCIILTFAAFFLIETIYKKHLHLVQYGLAGLALVLFYTLLLSISEYTGFNPAYLLSGIATIGLVTWYVGSVMRSSGLALFISLVLAVVYAYIFCIIQLQDYALLMGSIGLFIALAIIMYFSRKLQW
jgi:inner membrane protein